MSKIEPNERKEALSRNVYPNDYIHDSLNILSLHFPDKSRVTEMIDGRNFLSSLVSTGFLSLPRSWLLHTQGAARVVERWVDRGGAEDKEGVERKRAEGGCTSIERRATEAKIRHRRHRRRQTP